MPSTVTPEVPTVGLNGGPKPERRDAEVAGRRAPPRSPLLAKITSLTSVAMFAAVGMMIVGVVAVIGGNYDKQVVRDQLTPQKISFPDKGSPALLPGIAQYAGQQVVTGGQAKAYANDFINVHLSKIAGGKTYAEVSAAAIADPKNAQLAEQKASLFQGETLRGLLLNAWGWSVVGTVATVAGFVLLGLGAILLLLPLANWQVNIRGRRSLGAAA
jgi:hypothetical protein